MGLTSDLISQFVKATKDTETTKTEATVYATVVKQNDSTYVQLDGSDILTPVIAAANTIDGERVIVAIKNHTAIITGNISSPAARVDDIEDVSDLAAKIAEFEIIIADKVSTDELDAESARIDALISDNVLIKESLYAAEADIDNLQAQDLTVEDTLTAHKASIEKLEADIADFDAVTVDELEAINTSIHNLEATYAEFDSTTTQKFEAIDAVIADLDVTYATIEDLDVERGRITNLETKSLTADSAVITDLQSDVANIDTLIFGSASGSVIQTSFANAVIAQLGAAQIKSAMIESVSADKITAGDIITNNVRVMSEDGSLLISDETIQISDDTRVRVQIGKDAANDYSINIWDADGNLMFSEGGITDSAIKEAIIRNDMVSDTANIAAHKLDIDSLFEEINGSTNTIKSSKVYLDDEGQTLDVVFGELSTQVDGLDETVTSQGTAISVIQGQISSMIWQEDIDTASDTMNTRYSSLEQTIDSLEVIVAEHTSEVDSVTDRVAVLETGLDGFRSTVSETYATKATASNIQNIATTAYENSKLQSDVTNYSQLNDDTASKWGFTADETADGHWYTMDVLSRDKFISDWHACNGGERFRVNFEISTSCMGNTTRDGTDSVYRGTALGLYCFDASGTSVGISYTDRIMATAEATPTKVSFVVTISEDVRKFRVFVQTDSYGNFSGSIKVRNVRVEKIDKTLESIVVSNRSVIEQHDDSIAAAVSRISENETDIASLQLTADGLTSRVSATETDVETALTSAANAQADIDALEIGGRNLFEHSAVLSTGAVGRYFAPEVPPYTITMEEDSTTPSGNCAVCTIGEITTAITNGGFYLAGAFGNFIPKLVVGETYTVSVWAKGSREMPYGAINAEFLKNGVRQDSNILTTDWQRFIVTGVYNGNTASSIVITFYYNDNIQSDDIFYFSSPQIEKGNQATDWSMAHEDLATADELAIVQSSNEAVEERVAEAESLIQQLSDSISMLVTDGNGESLMVQTETGWTFSTGQLQSAVDTASENLATLMNDMDDTDLVVNALQQAVSDLGVLSDYIKIGTYENEPCIELGESDSDFKLLITNTRIMFMEGSGVPAYLNNQSLFIKKAVIEEELQQGEFIWKARSNGNLGLIWKGVTS